MEKLIAVVLVPLTLMVASWLIFKDYHGLSYIESQDCRKYCEWQMSQMTETFNTLKIQMNETCRMLIASYEERLKKLHDSDLNMALIREQHQKEFVSLFQYEVQTFQGYYNRTVEWTSSQFCTKYCSSQEMQLLQECKNNYSAYLWSERYYLNERHLYLENRLRHLRNRLRNNDLIQKIKASAMLSTLDIFNLTVIFFFVILAFVIVSISNLYCLHKEYILSVTAKRFKSRAEKGIKVIKNLHTFWQKRLATHKGIETEMKQELGEKCVRISSLENQLSTSEILHLKEKKRLTSEISSSHTRILQLEETLLKKKLNDRTTVEHRILVKRVKDQDDIIRELEDEIKGHIATIAVEREKSEIAYRMERERTIRELQRNSRLQTEVVALREQTSRLEKGLQAKVAKASKRGRILALNQYKDQAVQTIDTSEDEVSRLTDIRQDFETRLTNLQKTLNENLAKETEEVKSLRKEHEELRIKLEVANKRCSYLEERVQQAQPTPSQILMCNVEKIKLKQNVHGWSQSKLKTYNIVEGLQSVEAHFLTPPFVDELAVPDFYSAENYLSVQ